MDIKDLVITTRLRNHWSAIDLGFSLARKWYFPLLASWIFISLPLFIILSLLLPDNPTICYLVIWWLKPFWDRGPLLLISRYIFSVSMPWKSFIKEYPRLLKKHALHWLTFRRFNTSRSYNLPVDILEGLSGSDYTRRISVLHSGKGVPSSWLTIICIHFEMIIAFGLVGLAVFMVPREANIDYWQFLQQQTFIVTWVNNYLVFFAMAFIAPFYVCAGFSLYINKRIQLEGWDIELQFRELQQRYNKTINSRKPIAAIILMSCCFFSLMDSQQALASDTISSDENVIIIDSATEASRLINDVMKSETFNKKEKRVFYRLKSSNSTENPEKGWFARFLEWIADKLRNNRDEDTERVNLDGFAIFLEFLFWLCLFAIICICLYTILKHYDKLPSITPTTAKPKDKPATLFGLDVREQSLPKDISSVFFNLVSQQHYREALSLLYQSMLVKLIHDYHFDFEEGTTEQECSAIVKISSHEHIKPCVENLTHTWQDIAYAHQIPSQETIEGLYEQWRGAFAND